MKCITTQKFAENKNPSYKGQGLKGHTGEDWYCGYGTEIECPLDGVVYKIIDDKRQANDGSGFWGIFILFQHKGQWKEFLIGHCSRIYVSIGQKVSKGQIIGSEGNRGIVFEGSHQITKEMQDNGDRRGSHRHYQTRLLRRTFAPFIYFLTRANNYGQYRDDEGYAYEIVDYENGYNGCVDCRDVLDEYEQWKVMNNIPFAPNEEDVKIIQRSFLDILRSYLEILKTYLKSKK